MSTSIMRFRGALLFCMVWCCSVADVAAQANFYKKKASFEETLISSFERINEFEREHGVVFVISEKVPAKGLQRLSLKVKNANAVFVGSMYAAKPGELWAERVNPKSSGYRIVNPVWETNEGKLKHMKSDLPLMNSTTQLVNLLKPSEVKLKDGNKTVAITHGFSCRYLYVSEVKFDVDDDAQGFSTLVGPENGNVYAFAYTDGFANFLSALKADFPVETEIFLGEKFRYLNRISGFKDGNQKLWWKSQIQQLMTDCKKLSNSNTAEASVKLFYDLLKRKEYIERYDLFDFEALELAIKDLINTYRNEYSKGAAYLQKLAAIRADKDKILKGITEGNEDAFAQLEALEQFRAEALLANPAIDFENLLMIKRKKVVTSQETIGHGADPFGMASNFQSLTMVNRDIWDNEIASFSLKDQSIKTVLKPKGNKFIGLFDLHFDKEKMLFSMPGDNLSYQVYEANSDGTGVRQVTPEEEYVDNYDACYLPNGDIVFSSTRCMHGVPCVAGKSDVANLCRMDRDGKNIRMLCFDQDDDWHPTILNNGKVMYTRWEYTDTPHFVTRILMNMNPDGTNQKEYYGSSSYWPNSIFYAKAIPNHPTKVVGIVSGHHGTRRAGELVIFDPVKGRFETEGVVQRIPGRGKKVEAKFKDRLVEGVWPKFLTPYPINDKYFLVAMQKNQYDNFGIYLVDVFDNIVPIVTDSEYSFFEPVPFKKTAKPPVIPDKVDLSRKDATVYIMDIYEGRSMKNVPRGTVKALRLFEPNYAVRKSGGHINIGIDGAWDAKKILGTVPVYEDGSAHFKVPANTPIAVQPLDEKGQAVQVMRSWFTAMPGEKLSCVGCHEDQNMIPQAKFTRAVRENPSEIKEWYGPARGFRFKTEVQPVLDRYCVGCHKSDNKAIPDFTRKKEDNPEIDKRKGSTRFTPSYANLHKYVRRPGNEGDYHIQNPYEYHAGTSELIQLLRKGHHNVELDEEAWSRLITWIDLNVPDKGSWTERNAVNKKYVELREKYRRENANLTESPEVITKWTGEVEFIQPKAESDRRAEAPKLKNWPFSNEIAKQMQNSLDNKRISLNIADDIAIDLVHIPGGDFVMGNSNGAKDEQPVAEVSVKKAFYMSTTEITNEVFQLFKADHKQGVINYTNKDVAGRGYAMDGKRFPVVRVSWDEALAFCNWLSEKTGKKVSLPTEAQWEWACRAGSQSDFYYGDSQTDFSGYANLADQSLKKMARKNSPEWHPRDDRFSDNALITCEVSSFSPNVWGLYDMHGNVAEWTRSCYQSYPYADDKKGDLGTVETLGSSGADSAVVVRGGSWYDRPYRATSSYRLAYLPHQKVHNVGFRVIVED
ncbi:formylglycine-generating enzyme family protein [Puteibacter caeruleilacunae]|nr:formylglycine-generating enzyme family protein [Puteibacter caeruleilacunae]